MFFQEDSLILDMLASWLLPKIHKKHYEIWVFTVVLLKFRDFWDLTLSRLVYIFTDILEECIAVKTSVIICQSTQHNMSETLLIHCVSSSVSILLQASFCSCTHFTNISELQGETQSFGTALYKDRQNIRGVIAVSETLETRSHNRKLKCKTRR